MSSWIATGCGARRGGLRVKTTDPRLQRQAESALRYWLRLPSDPAGASSRSTRRPGRCARWRCTRPAAGACTSTSPRSRAASPAARSRSSRWRRRWRPASRSARSGAARARRHHRPALPDRERALGRRELRRPDPGDDVTPAGHRLLGEHDLCAGRVARRALEGRQRGAPHGDRVAAPAGVLAHARAGGLPARDDQRLRDAGGARDPPSCRDAPARDRAGRQGRAPDSS